jgi:transposase
MSKLLSCRAQGGTIQGIARRLQISRQTVRKFVQAPSFPELQRVPRYVRAPLTSIVRICENEGRAGSRTTDQLWKELQERGFSGSWMMVYRWVQLQNDAVAGSADQPQPQTPATAKRMAPRHLAWLLLRDPEHLEKREQQQLALLRQEKNVDLAYGLAQQFVAMVKERNTTPLDTWLWDCQMSGISDLMTFAQGLEKEGSALHAALTLPYSNGPVEGKINKLKFIKRSMYGRAGFPLLRQKVLKAA